ncbi:MAG: tetratricopeptide repeat protein, partial [Dactylosporangium sp.]|nr:tetratricopeptide repeat protein [Dactylosporangium sp.]NNJ61502.1 tetratricopeptide repeat protein [Dactylosporangium sp.]
VAIHAVDGMAGVGKTALAIHAAHRLAGRFPDGQRFVALRAHAPGQTPVDPAAALATLLQADGVAAAQIPASLDSRAGLWRDRMATKRMLLVLDDAADPDHVALLLPAAPGSLVLITSRRKLTTLPNTVPLPLDTLPPAQARALFTARAGRGHDDPRAAAQITALCGWLPLAVTLAAARLHTHPAWSVTDLATELATTRDRLAELASGDLAVAAAFDLSYRDLPAARQRLFRRLGLHPGPDVDPYAVAALDDTSLADARRGLEDLLEHNLMTEPHRGRYRLHDLIAEHARSRAADDPPAERDAARDRLLGFYLHTATTAGRYLARNTAPAAGAGLAGSPPAEVPTVASPEQAADWLAREQPNLVATAGWAATHHRAQATIAIPAALHEHLHARGPWSLARDLHRTALTAARHANDRPAQASTLANLADIQRLTGDHAAAATSAGRALDLSCGLGDRVGQANALTILGWVQCATGGYAAAATSAGRALDLSCGLGDRLGQAKAHYTLGYVQCATGGYAAAAASAGRALDLSCELGNRLGQANALTTLGQVRHATGDHAAASTSLGQALDLFREAADRDGEAETLNHIGELLLTSATPAAAQRRFTAALGIARTIGTAAHEARALEGIGTCARRDGHIDEGVMHLRQALAIYRRINSPNVAGIEATLRCHGH